MVPAAHLWWASQLVDLVLAWFPATVLVLRAGIAIRYRCARWRSRRATKAPWAA